MSLATYPALVPRHGGQKRVATILRGFAMAGFKTFSASISSRRGYSARERGNLDFVASAETEDEINLFPEAEAVILGESIERNPAVREDISHLLLKVRPDVLSFEGPFLFPPMLSLIKQHLPDAKIINSTQNQEAALLESTLGKSRLHTNLISRVRDMESLLARTSDVSLVVSIDDGNYVRKLGSKRVVLFPNGIDVPQKRENSNFRVNWILKNNFVSKYALFVGSLHLPNITGFMSLVGTIPAALQPGHVIVIVGGAGPEISGRAEIQNSEMYSYFSRKVIATGPVPERELNAWLQGASLIVLPLLDGAGTNLKTAEALLSGKRILATDVSFRGFEQWKEESRVTICNDPEMFNAEIERLLSLPEETFPPIRDVTWDSNLPILVETARSLLPS